MGVWVRLGLPALYSMLDHPKQTWIGFCSWSLGLFYFFRYVYVHVSEDSQRDQNRAGAGGRAVVSCLTWVLGTELGLSVRATCAQNR